VSGSSVDRREQLAANLDRVRARIGAACQQAGRSADEVTLTVVTKFFPAADVRLLAGLGVRHVGENRHQEAQAKAEECADLELTWHFIGALQSNKAAAVPAYASVVESVDREKLLAPLGRGAHEADRRLDVLVQVSLDETTGTGRAGVAPDRVLGLADAVATTPGLRLRGLMAVAPLGRDPQPGFAKLAALAARVRDGHPDATWVSAGMSGDLEAAVGCGATHVRIGSAVLGERPPER
jgi:pyridoxal phosphate enzyme (YggS family)